MTREVINELKKYTLGKKNTEKVEINVLQLNRVIKALEQEPVLDKIRAEIEQLADANGYGDYLLGYNFGLMRAVQIIDKYRGEEV